MYRCISSLVLNSLSFMCATVRFPDKRAVNLFEDLLSHFGYRPSSSFDGSWMSFGFRKL